MGKISAVIITFNEQACISRCIRSLKPVADEIIVLDSFSADNTAGIARAEGAKVFQDHFHGYKEQKNIAIKLASNDYILSLDADESLSVELIHSILLAKQTLAYKAYTMNRSNFYCGQFIRYGLWYPDRKTRLFDRRFSYWGGMNPHDKIIIDKNYKSAHLAGDILHYSFNSIAEHRQRNEDLSRIAAESLYQSGAKNPWLKIYTSPAWRFIKSYLLKLGFLDGKFGFIIAKNIAHQAYLKYKKLKQLREHKSETSEKQLVSASTT